MAVYTATVTLTTSGQSIQTLLEAAGFSFGISKPVPRVSELKVQAGALTQVIQVTYKGGAIAAGDVGFTIGSAAPNVLTFELRQAGENKIGLSEIFLSGAAGGESARIFAYQV